jgi:hypothetical protein
LRIENPTCIRKLHILIGEVDNIYALSPERKTKTIEIKTKYTYQILVLNKVDLNKRE